ncbi:MAG: DNA helicase RecQ [Pseudomonadota bacterium]
MKHQKASSIDPLSLLKSVYGYDEFRDRQEAVITHVLTGGDAFVLMPTGSGKSLCYQIPAMIRRGVGIVVSPLIALMQDQVAALRQNGVRADFLNSSLAPDDARRVVERVRGGGTDILYVAPERLLTEGFQHLLSQIPIALFAIDEVHCVSQWGHDFRPEYLNIAAVTGRFPDVPRLALTATADALTRRDIIEKLDLSSARQFLSSFDRPNITYRVQIKTNDKQQLLAFLTAEHAGQSGIVYLRTRRRTDAVAAWLLQKGINALPYHAGLDADVRTNHQARFLREEAVVMVATIAFGMGIDKPDVRFVAHLDLPASMEAYYQETGRAGRDGAPADAWMVYSLSDVVAMRKLMEGTEAEDAIKRIRSRKLEALLGFAETVSCRREALLGYFGEAYTPPCGACDNCTHPVETWDATVAAQKALSCVYRTGQRFGAAHLTDVLIGNDTERISRLGHNRLKTFGVGTELNAAEWRSVFRQLTAAGLLSVNLSEISGFRLTEESRAVLKGAQAVRMRKDPKPIKTGRKAAARQINRIGDDEVPADVFDALRRLRTELARQEGVPPYVVFHDSTLRQMALLQPRTPEELLLVSGIGEKKAEKYGRAYLSALADIKENGQP